MCQALAFRPRERHAIDDSAPTTPISASSEVLYEVADHVATITLNAPERMNTISGLMLGEISVRLLEADRDRRGPLHRAHRRGRAFCAGLDLQAQMAGPKGGLGNLGGPSVVHRRVRTARRPADRAAQHRHADDLRAQRRRRRLRPRPGARAATSASPPTRPSSTPGSPSAASCRRAVAPGCCRAWSATPRRPRSRSPGAR